MKLTDTELVLLSTAAQREDRCIDVAAKLKGTAAAKVVRKLLNEGLAEETPAQGALSVWRRDDETGPRALRITERGLAALGIDQDNTGPNAAEREGPAKPDSKTIARVVAARTKKAPGRAAPTAKPKRAASKQSRVIEMLQRREGASVKVIMKATGWQPHSVCGFFTGVVRNKLGLTLVSEKNGKERVYRIVPKGATRKATSKTARKAA